MYLEPESQEVEVLVEEVTKEVEEYLDEDEEDEKSPESVDTPT